MMAILREKQQLLKLGPQEELGPVAISYKRKTLGKGRGFLVRGHLRQYNQRWDHQHWDSLHWEQLKLHRRLEHDQVSLLDWENPEGETITLAKRSQYLRHQRRQEVALLQSMKM